MVRLLRNFTFLFFLLVFARSSYSQCGTTYISSDDTTICVPKIVKFKVHSFPAGTTFEWDLGQGYVSSDSTYTKLYPTAGNFNVRVKLKYVNGSSCILDQVGFIKAKPVPVPQFSISKKVICNYKDSVVITDLSPKSVYRDWLVENTLYSNGPAKLSTIFHTPAGYKFFTIFMKDSFGCEGKKTFDSVAYVPDSIPVSFIADKMQGCTPKPVNFINTTDTMGNAIASWNWSFPGASPASSNAYQPKNITYNTRDTFDVGLIATTRRGCVYSHFEKDYLKFADSVVMNTGFSKTTLCGNDILKITLNNIRSTRPNLKVTPAGFTMTTIDPTHYSLKFKSFGKYTVYVSDTLNGCVSEKTYSNLITVNGPIAKIYIKENYSCLRPDSLAAVDSSSLNVGVSKTLKWDLFFDTALNASLQTGTSSPMKFGLKQYASYAVRLIVTGNNGCADTALAKSAFLIKQIMPSFDYKPIPACPGEIVDFTNTTPRGTSKVPNRYRWTFYNVNNTVFARDTIINPKVSYPDSGAYSVKLLAFNNLGCKDSITYTKYVKISKPTPKFVLLDSNICYGEFIRIRAEYNDSNYYKYYHHYWLFQHKDSANTSFYYYGDSIKVNNLFPGRYSIKYTRYSVRNTCHDTFRLSYTVRVSGARYLTGISPVKGCSPFTSTLTARLTYNYNYKNGNTNPNTVHWTNWYDTNQIALRQPDINPTKVYVKKSGKFSFRFNYAHPSGCDNYIDFGTLNSGVVASYVPNANQYYACVDKPLKILNNSDPDAVAFKWFVRDSTSGYSFLPTDTSKQAKILFTKQGIYDVGLIAYGQGNCNDTSYGRLYVNDIKARFSSADTLNYCAPVIARISAVTHPAILSYKWYLGDGDSITNNLSSFGHLYKTNTGPPGSDVTLIVKGYGCNDTVTKHGFIKVIGPIPKFHLSNNNGCETLRVNFINESKYYKRFFLEYGDGSVLDSVNFNYHAYQIFDRSLPSQRFKPVLSVIDTFGCFVQYQNDSVEVLKSPDAKFSVNRDTGCSTLPVTFINITIGGVSYQWDFDGNGTVDNKTFSPKYNYPAGDFNPALIAQSANGCRDTINNIVHIKSYARPDVTFAASKDTICYNSSINFTAKNSPFDSDIVKWNWDFGDPFSVKDTSTRQNPSYTFKKLLLSHISLLVTDKNSCTDTFDKFIYVIDTTGPKSTPMNFVTVSNNKDISINWGKSGVPQFKSYALYNDNSGYSLLYSTPTLTDTTYKVTSGIDVSSRSYCYVIRTRDLCNNIGSLTYPHCTIFLQVSDDSANDLRLDWLKYDGWGPGKVERYRIYRSENGGPFKLLDSTTQNTYIDKKLCNNSYCYYIDALQKGGSHWTSRSNTVCKFPKYIKPVVPVSSIRTTVLPDGRTYTQWEPYRSARNINNYIVGKTIPGGGTNDHYANVDSTGFIDNDVLLNTNLESYIYTVRVNDHCDQESPESAINKTILLSGKSEGYVARLKWTEYEKWFSGIKEYQVWIRENNTFKLLGKVGPDTQTYELDMMDTELDDSICFKIQAIKDTSKFVESFSNMLCLISGAKVWVPSAFSPNNDGHNDVFLPKSILIFNNTGNEILDFQMDIYNRWGEQVFTSTDAKAGWDGTYKGNECPQGHYVYKVRALALDGITTFNLEGVLVLLR